ncbi:hypothetical protein [Buttiauxella sp. S04-F03]|uniref:hypothetical protein n=1 Tax=Buttiauxella sp. S04-F03 TaxID=2904525 RepID=UPI001E47FE49|nr:hypothetical protein [Buttiauxella sp. S04-F03]MCE0812423.1 hypothetical protein [Buttiauxella sp. S04-F03]
MDQKYRKNVDLAYEALSDALTAIDALGIDTKVAAKKYAGVRTSLIRTYYLAVEHKEETKLPKWVEFWNDFYNDEPSNVIVTTLLSSLISLASNDSKAMISKCTSSFESHIA